MDMAHTAEIARATDLDNLVYDEEGNLVSEIYWQGWMGDPVNATIQVLGPEEEDARNHLGEAAWQMLQNRQTTQEAAETPVTPLGEEAPKATRTRKSTKKTAEDTGESTEATT
jgi:hypothetical protein